MASSAKVRDVPAEKFIKAYAAHLKANDKLQVPTWVDLVKTAPHKELAPYDPDWYYVRAAAIARRIYLRQGLGCGALRRSFGCRYSSRGTLPEKHADASGGVIRHILKQFEANNLMEKTTGPKGGRKMTPSGQRDLDLIAARVASAMAEAEE
uniref:Small subunit ribosomal protein S19e n=1 Tax=Tetraselmis sp. GSL018 TaxID=582737 RepID=A0A061RE45_9CHLO